MPASPNDPHPNEYTFAEKLAAVNAGVMAPEDLGVLPTPGDASEATAGGLEIKPATPEELAKKPETGDYIVFQAAVVPLDLRATWSELDAKATNKILPFTFDKEAWKDAHKHEHVIQAKFQCGTASGAIEGKFSDKVLGLCNLLDAASKQIREFYANEKSKTDTATPPMA